MGGNALKNVRRMDAARYEWIKEKVLGELSHCYESVLVPFEVPGKVEHGDLDVLCLPRSSMPLDASLHPKSRSEECVSNGHVLCFEYDGHQIDIIHVNSMEELLFAQLFYSYGDTGMILGMLCKRVNLVLTDRQLSVRVPEPYADCKIHLSSNVSDVLQFLGLSEKRWKLGFREKHEIYSWIAESRFFCPSIFYSTHCSSKKKERPMFGGFVKFCETVGAPEPVVSPSQVYTEAMTFFGKSRDHDALIARREKEDRVKNKFNGKLVMEWTGASGKDVGRVVAGVKMECSDDNLLEMSFNDIKTLTQRIFISRRC